MSSRSSFPFPSCDNDSELSSSLNEIPSFCLNQEPSTPNNLLMGVTTTWELCLWDQEP